MTATLSSQLATPPRPPIPALDRAARARGAGGGAPLVQQLVLRRASVSSADARGRAHAAAVPGLGGEPARLPARRFRGRTPRSSPTARIPRCGASGSQRIVDHDGTGPGTGGIELWIRLGVALGVPREEMEDERHVLPGRRLICESYVTFCKTKPWIEARRLVAHRAVRAQDPPAADRGVSQALPVDPARGARLLQEPPGPGAARRPAGLWIVQQHCTTVETQRGAFRGAGVQARDAVGDDRHDPPRVREAVTWH